MKVLVSNCLLGISCRYDGNANKSEKLIEFLKDKIVIGVCPEVMGGLPTPRPPAERIGDKIIAITEKDVSNEYNKGAEIALEFAKKNNVDLCIMKSRSPSCGKGLIYDGTFSGKKIEGNGVTAELLMANGFKVITDEELESML